ncbi:dihydrodipicolinate synthase family protein [Paracoccus laeviglucosivorans]|uniref:4-hydroxy-tetrahydrodipicolinate synthase n=1 Tax=Paracoccus laeviglucosivorans TaxID=1197861 RepID=A0A521AZN9_9RHOB|nr:dihydrodipicolinate synthase family protein [Paracoccus laeviglucosivorans]SMO40231.1 4-hydroxy-tetrahydrodipicolinate synthase [Paracoccus laeviglucosivorans]
MNGGIYAATICTLTPDGRIDTDAQQSHFSAVLETKGIHGLLLNGHAGEGIFMSRDEQAHVIALARQVAPDTRILAAVSAEATAWAVADGLAALRAGADAVMVFPPYSWALGADPRAIVAHHRGIADATGAPIYLFQGAVGSGKLAYAPDTLRALMDIDSIVGIKEGSWETRAYETTRRIVHAARPDVAVMASGDEHLLSCYLIGSEGSAVSLAAILPELIVALDQAVRDGQLTHALQIHTALFDFARLVYAAPGHMAAARLKACLAELGRIPCDFCHAPTPAVTSSERTALMAALRPCLALSIQGGAD